MSNKRLIDGEKLLEWLGTYLGRSSGDQKETLETVIRFIEYGSFDPPSNQGEAARLREALEEISKFRNYTGEHWTTEWKYDLVLKIADEALSSHTEDTEIQKVIDILLNSKVEDIEINHFEEERQYGTGEGDVHVLPAYSIITITTTGSIPGIKYGGEQDA